VTENFAADIPLSIAQAAHAGTSFVPEKRAEQERSGYAQTLASDFENLARGLPQEKHAQLAEEFDRYRQGYRRHYLAMLASRSRCMSTMIAGPSNFPVGRMQKRNAVADRRISDLVEFRERALKAIHKALHPELAPIMLGDSDASTRLQQKIQTAELVQSVMKRANAIIRKHAKEGPTRQVAELVALGLSEGKAKDLLIPDACGRIGFADYEVKNNNANIRRMKQRLGQVERTHAQPAQPCRAPPPASRTSPPRTGSASSSPGSLPRKCVTA
jgi:hypothetical protein